MSEQQQPESKVTYAKRQDGTYGLRITGFYPTEGQTVTVTKKNGETSSATVGKITWQGVDKYNPSEYIFLCTIAASGAARNAPPAPPAPPPPPPPKETEVEDDPNLHYPTYPVGDDSHLNNQDGELISGDDLNQIYDGLSSKERAEDDNMLF